MLDVCIKWTLSLCQVFRTRSGVCWSWVSWSGAVRWACGGIITASSLRLSCGFTSTQRSASATKTCPCCAAKTSTCPPVPRADSGSPSQAKESTSARRLEERQKTGWIASWRPSANYGPWWETNSGRWSRTSRHRHPQAQSTPSQSFRILHS